VLALATFSMDDASTSSSGRLAQIKGVWSSLFFVEVWVEKREIWKEFTFHAALYFVSLAVLELGHRALEYSTLPQLRKDVIDAVHFYLYPILLVVLGTGFLIKAYRIQFPREASRG